MAGKRKPWAPLFILILFFSCSSQQDPEKIKRYQVQKIDFVNALRTSGFIEATSTHSIACPGINTDATILYLIPEGTTVQKGDTVCILEAREIENNHLEAIKQLENAQAEYEKSVANLNLQYLLLQSQVQTIDAQTDISKLDSAKQSFLPLTSRKIIQLKIERAEIEKDKLQKKLEFLQRINESELRKMKKKIEQAENNVAREKAILEKLVLKADVAGMIVYERLWTSGIKVREGDIVWGNMPIAQIPDMSQMQARLLVNDTKFKRIETDQEVTITIDAFPEIQLKGKIVKKAPMGKPIKEKSKIKIFEVYASVDSTDFRIQPGLSVTCDVYIESIPDTIVVPLLAIFDKDSTKIVYVKNGSVFTKQPVQIAASSENYAVISNGLKYSQEIALLIPPDALIKL